MYIYVIENQINHKKYVGLDSRNINEKRRWLEHIRDYKNSNLEKVLYKAMRKYGLENFSFNILEELKDNDIILLKEREKYWIKTLKSTVKGHGYNMTDGGDTSPWKYMSDNQKEEHINKVKLGSNLYWSNLTSEERKEKTKHLKLWQQTTNKNALHQQRLYAQKKAVEMSIKDWVAESPDGTIIRFKNMREFCRVHNLEPSLLHLVTIGKQYHHKNWKCWAIDDNGNRVIPSITPSHHKANKWTLVDPSGIIHEITNLKDFCIEHNLNYKSIHKVTKEIFKQHQNWTLFKE